MIGSTQHSLAKWLTSILDPVLLLYYSTNCIQDSFTFAQIIRQFDLRPSAFLCSFDIPVSSVFTNVCQTETINICSDVLYSSDLRVPSFPREDFIELMQKAIKSVEFNFNNVMYGQIDGVAMGSPLGPAMANTFVDYYESLLFRRSEETTIVMLLRGRYFCYL